MADTKDLSSFDKLKETNPKDALGIKKVPLHVVPSSVMMEMGLAMLEGGRKYGSHNYRVTPVLASVYYDATMRHLMAWWEGEDTDPASGLSHLVKAIASLAVARDAMTTGKFIDDRPPVLPLGWVEKCNQLAADIIERYPDSCEPCTEAKHGVSPEQEQLTLNLPRSIPRVLG